MKLTKVIFVSFAVSIIYLFITSTNMYAQEKKISEKEVPASVMSAFHKAYPKAEIKGTSIETEKGKKYYEIESIEGTKHIDLLISKDGQIAEVEETIPVEQLPSRIMKTLETKFKEMKIDKAEKVTRGAISNYELVIESSMGKREVKLNAAGKLLKSEKVNGEIDKAD